LARCSSPRLRCAHCRAPPSCLARSGAHESREVNDLCTAPGTPGHRGEQNMGPHCRTRGESHSFNTMEQEKPNDRQMADRCTRPDGTKRHLPWCRRKKGLRSPPLLHPSQRSQRPRMLPGCSPPHRPPSSICSKAAVHARGICELTLSPSRPPSVTPASPPTAASLPVMLEWGPPLLVASRPSPP